MAINKQSYQITGMRQDNLVGTGYSNKFAHEIMNLRLNTVGDYTTASWTTEEGTLLKPVDWVDAPSDALALLVGNDTEANPIVPIGQAVINDQWIVFATQTLLSVSDPAYSGRVGYDFIFKYWYQEGTNQLMGTILYAGNLNFDAKHPCETLAFYENESVQKVYWTDGKNQPRVINIKRVKYHTGLDGQFDFVQEVSLEENVKITKKTDGAGLFPPGTVKYAITYYKKYGQETNIVYDSPLHYPIKGQRGCSPEELSGDSFEIKVTNLDTTHGFDYIRLYSIVRTSENATPVVRIVEDKELESLPLLKQDDPDYNPNKDLRYALFEDTNTTGEIVDPTVLQYVGGKEIIAQTFDQKNNTMFLGNIELKTKSVQEVLNEYNNTHPNNILSLDDFDGEHLGNFLYDDEKVIGIRVNKLGQDSSFYQYTNQMSEAECWDATSSREGTNIKCNGDSFKIKIFKWMEHYRFGIQFQDSKGNWSDVVLLRSCITNDKPPVTTSYESTAKFATFQYTLPNILRQALYDGGFKKARIVCCYPNNTNRAILTQGLLNPTITHNEFHSTPDAMASWFFRPVKSGSFEEVDKYETNNRIAFKYSDTIYSINSPELTFDESIRTLDLDKTSLVNVGVVPVKSYASTYYINAGAPMTNICGYRGSGFNNRIAVKLLGTSLTSIRSIGTDAGYWRDLAVYNWDHGTSDTTHTAKYWTYRLYPYNRIGSLNDYVGDKTIYATPNEGDPEEYPVTQTAKLTEKVYSNIAYSTNSIYSLRQDIVTTNIEVFDSTEVVPLKIDKYIYNGNSNIIAPVGDADIPFYFATRDETGNGQKGHSFFGRYKIYDTSDTYYKGSWGAVNWSGTYDNKEKTELEKYSIPVSSSPIPITFNSTPHAVVKLSQSLQLPSTSVSGLYIPLVELTKSTRESDIFGDVLNNVFIPCGPSTSLNSNGDITIKGVEGDSYFMRYDCLKTYPRSTEDINQIVEILSFMCETRINLDGRYDRNRGLADNTTITNTNFNLINKSYTQSNNFFSYTTLDEDTSTLNKFANLITWTKDKVSGEDVDTWTNITLASTADAEGVCGEINKIVNVNDTLYSFQDHGIAQIGYNEKTALSTLEGVPLEIANSGKFSGLKYVTKEIGCQNKWSISLSKNGAFFIDDSRQELLTLGQGVTSLSTANGLDAFLIQQLPDSEHFTPWTPFNPGNFVSYYDKLGNDVLYINRDYCLAWNEQSHTFTSFYSYNNVPLMANIGTHLLMWDINTPLVFNLDSTDVEEEVTTYTPTVTTTTEEIEHTTTTTETVTENPIYNDNTHLVTTIYQYVNVDESAYNNGLFDTPTNWCFTKTYYNNSLPFTYWRESTTDFKTSWIRLVLETTPSYSSDNYNWNAHYLLSLEFRKNSEPFIIQFEIEGTHTKKVGKNGWDTSVSLPIIKIRTTPNVTEEEFSLINLYLGGQYQPTLNTGNVIFDNIPEEGYDGHYKSNGVQPWGNVDDSFITEIDGVERELRCIVKLYDLSTIPYLDSSNTSAPINAFLNQSTPLIIPFKSSQIKDDSSDVDLSMYNPEDIRYNTTTTIETIEHTTTTWAPVTETKTTTHYVVHSASSNIWAARENDYHCCEFFGHYKPYWMTLVCDGMTADGNAFPADKVFNNIEYRADVFDRITGLPRVDINLPVFDMKAAYNGYQAYREFPIDGVRKFNTWRVQLPRATYYDNGQFVTTRDRIRNPFCYIKLGNTNGTDKENFPNTEPLPNRMILHDLAVYFDMK